MLEIFEYKSSLEEKKKTLSVVPGCYKQYVYYKLVGNVLSTEVGYWMLQEK